MTHDTPRVDQQVRRIAELEATVARLETTLTALATRAQPAVGTTVAETDPVHDVASTVDDAEITHGGSSRRNLFKLAAGAAAGGVAIAAGSVSGRAAADDTDPLLIGEGNTQNIDDSTVLAYGPATTPQVPGVVFGSEVDGNVFLARDVPGGIIIIGGQNGSAYPAAVAGYAYRAVHNGVYGFGGKAGANGVVAYGTTAATGLLARGGRANVMLYNEGDAPSARTDAHSRGEILTDSNGDTWYCVADGTPGTWRKLSGATTAGAYHAVDPYRAWDSRIAAYTGAGLLAPNTSKVVSIADAHDSGGAVTMAGAVPAGATAVTYNVTITGTTGPNYLSVTPGDAASFTASTINWSDAGANLANGSTVKLDASRQVKLFCGDQTGSTHAIIDITGYYR